MGHRASPSSPGCPFWGCLGVRQGHAPRLEMLQPRGAAAELLQRAQAEQRGTGEGTGVSQESRQGSVPGEWGVSQVSALGIKAKKLFRTTQSGTEVLTGEQCVHTKCWERRKQRGGDISISGFRH